MISSQSKQYMKIFSIPLFQDNYAYLILGKDQNKGFLVDPADPQPIVKYLQDNHPTVKISHILLTHKHWDHTGDIPTLLSLLKQDNIDIIMGMKDAMPFATFKVDQETEIQANNVKIKIMPSPCHTTGHVLYYITSDNLNDIDVSQNLYNQAVFTGDTLFVGGCGRFFEGNAEQMLNNMKMIGKLPGETFVFCGHEYTVANLKWASNIETDNKQLQDKYIWAQEQRAKGFQTIPSTIKEEFDTNPFCRSDKLLNLLNVECEIKAMEILREYKNQNIDLSGQKII